MFYKKKFMRVIIFLVCLIILPINQAGSTQASTIQISSNAITLTINHYKTLSVLGTSKPVTWSSSNKTIATVSTGGKVTAKAPGTAIITATVSGKKLSCTVSVIKLSASSATLTVGAVKALTVYGTTRTVTWTSGNNAVATVASNGTVTARAVGTVTIYASVSGKKLSCIITVIKSSVSSATQSAIGTQTTTTTYSTASTTITQNPLITPSKRIIGYYAGWSRYSGFTPDKIDATKLTTINYAFANIGSDYKITLGYPDIDPLNISGLNKLKTTNLNLKTIISVGGWSWSDRFSDVALTEASRATFATSCVSFIVKYGFDGVDIDWEYPVNGGLAANTRRPEDKYNFTLLLKTLREKLDARGAIDGKKYILSFAGASGSWYTKNIEPSKISQYVNYANIMAYDIHGPWDKTTNFNAPLYTSSTTQTITESVDTGIKNWLQSGFPKDKLIMGVPFYGYIYKSVASTNYGLYQSYSGGASISYASVAANYLNAPGYTHYYSSTSRVPWLFNGSTFITYENPQSIGDKAKYIIDSNLGGAMIWELSQDPNKVLLNSLYQGLNSDTGN